MFRYPTCSLRLSFAVLFQSAVILSVALLLARRNVWVGAFLIVAYVSRYYPYPSVFTYDAFFNVLIGALWFYIIVQHLNTQQDVDNLLNAMCIIAISHTAILLFQAGGVQLFGVPIKTQANPSGVAVPIGLMANRNEVSALIAYCFPAFMRPNRHMLIIIPIVGLICAKSVGGVVGVAVGLTFYFVMARAWKLALVPLCITVIFAVFYSNPSLMRYEAAKSAFEFYIQRPLFGSGIGHWKVIFARIKLLPYNKHHLYTFLHNDFVQALFEMGITYALVQIGYFINVARRYTKALIIPMTAIIIIVVNLNVHFGMHIGTTAMVIITWLAIYEVKNGLKETHQTNNEERI